MGFKTICIPGTIDNDIALTEYTIGFDTALKTIVESVDKLRDTSSSHHRCSIVEVMGRYCGDLALHAGIATGAEMIITSERKFDKKELLESLKRDRLSGKRHAIVIITEHITDTYALAVEVEKYTGFETRATVLGHVQRGGQPTSYDRVLAARMGLHAIELVLKDIHRMAIGISGIKIVHHTIDEVLDGPHPTNLKLYKEAEKLK
jgi:6-phosphofructokinase 1